MYYVIYILCFVLIVLNVDLILTALKIAKDKEKDKKNKKILNNDNNNKEVL